MRYGFLFLLMYHFPLAGFKAVSMRIPLIYPSIRSRLDFAKSICETILLSGGVPPGGIAGPRRPNQSPPSPPAETDPQIVLPNAY